MDLAQKFIFDIGLIFFVAWAMILAAVTVVAFGRDIRAFLEHSLDNEPQRLNPPMEKASLRRA